METNQPVPSPEPTTFEKEAPVIHPLVQGLFYESLSFCAQNLISGAEFDIHNWMAVQQEKGNANSAPDWAWSLKVSVAGAPSSRKTVTTDKILNPEVRNLLGKIDTMKADAPIPAAWQEVLLRYFGNHNKKLLIQENFRVLKLFGETIHLDPKAMYEGMLKHLPGNEAILLPVLEKFSLKIPEATWLIERFSIYSYTGSYFRQLFCLANQKQKALDFSGVPAPYRTGLSSLYHIDFTTGQVIDPHHPAPAPVVEPKKKEEPSPESQPKQKSENESATNTVTISLETT